MNNQPTIAELLAAVRLHLQGQVMPLLEDERKVAYETRVAIHVISIIERELHSALEPLKEEWQRLDFVQGKPQTLPADPGALQPALAERNRKLCDEIRAGRYDFHPAKAALYEHLLLNARAELEINNPGFLEALVIEDNKLRL